MFRAINRMFFIYSGLKCASQMPTARNSERRNYNVRPNGDV